MIVQEINSYLYFGYLPKKPVNIKEKNWANPDTTKRDNLESLAEKKLIKRGVEALKDVFVDSLTDINDYKEKRHIVPISGGLDSRAILAGLIDLGLKDNITTVTFGTPGTLDYELGNLLAKEAGTRHHSFDLTKIDITQKGLENAVKQGADWTYLIDSFYNRIAPNKFGKQAVYWSGFLGDPTAGSHLLKNESKSWNLAISEFAKRNCFSKSYDLTHPNFSPEDVLPNSPIFDSNILTYDEQIDFSIRQEICIKPLVMVEGYDYIAPFINSNWINFILNIPYKYRKNEYLYKKILKKAYPKLFSLPIENNFGLEINASKWKQYYKKIIYKIKRHLPNIISGVNPKLNYINFDQAIRKRKDFKRIIGNNISDLKQRNMIDWIEIDEIWKAHQDKEGNYADALIALASLEIYLKVKGDI